MEDFLIKNSIALVALVVSVFTLYRNYLSPFSLNVRNAGRITLTKDPNTHEFAFALFFVDLIFSNTGSRKGVVEDVALKIIDHGKPVVFVGKYFNVDRQVNLTEKLPPMKLEPFIGFALKGDESVIRQIGFSQREGDSPFSYNVGSYVAEVHLFESKKKRWTKGNEFSFEVEQGDLDLLAKMQARPLPEGGFFVTMVCQDKRTNQSNDRIKKLG